MINGMKRSSLIIILVAIVLLGIVIALIVANMPQNKTFNWRETYDPESKEPYGTYIFANLLKEKNKGKSFHILSRESIKKYLEKNPSLSNTTYLMMGHGLYMNEEELKSLALFVERGNTAFVCLNFPSYDLLKLNNEISDTDDGYNDYIRDTVVDLSLINPKLSADTFFRYHYILKSKKTEGYWSFLDSSVFSNPDNKLLALGYIGNGYFNFIKMPHGKGNFYFHSTPYAFSNISMLEKRHWQYFNNVAAYLPVSDIIWDEYHKTFMRNSNNQKSPGPLKYIMANLYLRWAWYLLLLGILLYVVFFGKRRQRVIPVLSVPENTSVEYVHTITELYFRQNDNKTIAQHKMRLFQSFVRNKYYLTSMHYNDDFVKRLSLKSGISADDIKTIFATHRLIESRLDVTNGDLINFHSLIEHFYTNCK